MRMKRFLAPTLLVTLVLAMLIQLPLAIADRSSAYEWFNPIVEIRRILLDGYVIEPNEQAMQRAMIDAMIDLLDDPYTQYVPPIEIAEFNKQLRGTYAGIGAEVNVADGYLIIVTPMDDSPALHAGVLAGDVVLEIEGRSTFDVPISECVELLTGEAGTPVNIRVRHLDGQEEQLAIVRERIVTRTVKGLRRDGEDWSYCVDDALDLHYVRVTQFNADTVDELAAVLGELESRGLGGLVLDLRDNPGGGLDTAVAMADLFLREGTIITVRPRRGDEVVYRAKARETLPDFPMVVLVNGSSASASEIIAGALQENGRAKVLGMRTYGKGSVQEVRSLPYDAGTLKYTAAHYYLPSGRNINRNPDGDEWGVDPDPGMVVPITDEAYLERFRLRREYEIIRPADDDFAECAPTDWIRERLADEQLAEAAEALRGRVQSGEWTRVSEAEAEDEVFDLELKRATAARVRLLEQLRGVDERIGEMQERGAGAGQPPILPPGIDLTDGTLSIQDRDGRLIATYQIEGGDLALALHSVTLRPLGGAIEAPTDEN